jgi:Tol biopolymer transport system component
MEAFPIPEYKNGQTYATVTFMLRAAEAETTGGNLPFSLVPVSVNGTPSGVSEALREGGTVFAGGSGSALDVQEIRHHVVGTYTTGTDLPAWSTALGLNTTANISFDASGVSDNFAEIAGTTIKLRYSSAEIPPNDQYVDDSIYVHVRVYDSTGTTVYAEGTSGLAQLLDQFDGSDWTATTVTSVANGGTGTVPGEYKDVDLTLTSAGLAGSWDLGCVVTFTLVGSRNMGSDSGAWHCTGFRLEGEYTPAEAKTDVPTRHNSSTAKTITAALAQDQWGKYLVPQVPWVNPVKRSYGMVVDGTGYGCAFSPDSRFLAVDHGTSPYITVYDRSGSTFTKASALTAPEGTGNGCAFSPDGRFLAVAHVTSPYITVYEHDGDGTFTKVSALTAPEGTGQSCAWSPDGRFLAVAHTTSPYITVYERDGTTFTKVSALTAPEGNGQGCAFSPDGRFLAVAHATSPYITVYERADTTFTKVTALTAPEGSATNCAFSPDGRFLAVAHGTSPYITVYERSGSTFTKVSALTAPEGTGYECAFSPDGRFLAVAHDTSPFITVYQRSGTSFTKVTALTAPEGAGRGCAFSPDGRFLAVAQTGSPFIYVYETSGLNPREGYLWMLDPGER